MNTLHYFQLLRNINRIGTTKFERIINSKLLKMWGTTNNFPRTHIHKLVHLLTCHSRHTPVFASQVSLIASTTFGYHSSFTMVKNCELAGRGELTQTQPLPFLPCPTLPTPPIFWPSRAPGGRHTCPRHTCQHPWRTLDPHNAKKRGQSPI